MNSVTGSLNDRAAAGGGAWRGLLETLRGATRREMAFFLLIGLVLSGINATSLFEWLAKGNDSHMLLASIVFPILAVPFSLAGWLIADRTEGSRIPRTGRLVLGALGASLLAVLILPHAIDLIGLRFNGPVRFSDGKTVIFPDWVMQLCCFLDVATFAGLSYAALEMSDRRRRTENALNAERREQTALARQLLESRLAAMQAQVEPQFLFDALVDIERLYLRNAGAAAANLDRLINHLRVALPRLRESGSSIQAEIELVESYLSVVQALHDGRPALTVRIAPECATRTFYPMLLLPLLQRAVRRIEALPRSIEISASERDRQVVIVLRIAAAALCREDDELARVRERLNGLYAGRARLDCAEPASGVTEFVLALPT
jgi:hypothetical protein